jgi:hypothetical protein
MDKIYRAWINQPSTLQALHYLHGHHCIAQDKGEDHVRIFFTEGPVHSMRVPRQSISEIHLSKATQCTTTT